MCARVRLNESVRARVQIKAYMNQSAWLTVEQMNFDSIQREYLIRCLTFTKCYFGEQSSLLYQFTPV